MTVAKALEAAKKTGIENISAYVLNTRREESILSETRLSVEYLVIANASAAIVADAQIRSVFRGFLPLVYLLRTVPKRRISSTESQERA
jgi:hypothetical protein